MRRVDRQMNTIADQRGLLSRAEVCHLALVDRGEPYLVTMNFGFEWEEGFPTLYFHSALVGRKIDVVRVHPRVCFSVEGDHELVRGDRACDFGMRYTCLVGYGVVSILTDDTERKQGLDAVMRQYIGPGPFDYDPKMLAHTAVLKLTVTEMTGKRKI